MSEVVHLCGVDDAILKEHTGAITTHDRRVSHFKDDTWVVYPTGIRQRLLRCRAFCENKKGRELFLGLRA